ncbi:gamma-glutamylcyclotransferase family protein [Primorskyibacter sp. S187A]|uniref:gamma-glutamylcyclotransferase family protein n=1 Tax=Primorskyibacter sp. S187A TaxID=3415130 RepID=UPI003C7C2803
MSAHHFFGYGSLVHARTHSFTNVRPATLQGWRRAWRHTPHRDVAFLTAVRAPGSAIRGVVADVPADDWAALDAREWAYARVMVTESVSGATPGGDIAVYAIAEGAHFAPTPAHPVLQSYLDTVLTGYEQVFGAAGLTHFLETTDGWHAPVLQDRDNPRYPRAQPLSPHQAAHIDGLLDTVGITRI